MGDLAAAGRHLDAVADLFAGPHYRRLAEAGARRAKAAAVEVAADLGPMSHMGRRGVRLSAGYDVAGDGSPVTIGLRPAGAWVIAERGAHGHTITVRRARRRGAGSGWGITPALYAGGYDHPVTAVEHPGAKGRKGIARAFGRARPAFTAGVHDAEVDALRSIYAG